jgi:N-ethylmaleimide reductase
MIPNLFSPIELGACALKNRIFMSPLTRGRAGKGNAPQELNALYYAQHAGAGLIVTEATQVSPEAHGYISTPGVHTTEHVEGWKRVTTGVHSAGGHIFLQLWHVGRSHPSFQPHGTPSLRPPQNSGLPHRRLPGFRTPPRRHTDDENGATTFTSSWA